MTNRPVLSMNFYQIDNSHINSLLAYNPYEEIKKQAHFENQYQMQKIQSKKKNANKVLQNINEKINRFFPDPQQEKQNKKTQGQNRNEFSFSQSSITQRNKTDKKYNKEYFDSLHQNLKDINQLINALDIDS